MPSTRFNYEEHPNILVGRTLLDMYVSKGRRALLFVTDEGTARAETSAECCSDTWIECIEWMALGFPAQVLSVENIPMPDLGVPPGHESVAYYGCRIHTDRGEIIIDYRNSSNGYYGGDLDWPDAFVFEGPLVLPNNYLRSEWDPVLDLRKKR